MPWVIGSRNGPDQGPALHQNCDAIPERCNCDAPSAECSWTQLREVEDQIWLASFLDFDLGFFDREEGRVEPAPNPFVPEKVLTMSPE